MAQPKDNVNFNNEKLLNCKKRCKIIKEIAKASTDTEVIITKEDVRKAINQLNTKKAADEYDLASEHLKHSGESLHEILQETFNQILLEEKVPSTFKTGTVSPILKKGKAFYEVENYRGITVTSVIGKVFEYIILDKANLMKSGQSPLQFGFTQGLSPNMAALILSEACSEITGKQTIFVTTLDSQKAFDVVSHVILMDRLYHYGLNLNLWNIIEELYSGVTSTVKWKGETSTSFEIHQGVRQGGVLSTHLYKAYINELLLDLQKRNLGSHIGNNYVGCPTCADDIVLLSLNREEMQEMLNIVDNYSKDHRFNIHPQKSNVIIKTGNKRKDPEDSDAFKMGNNDLNCTDRTTHLGLTRSTKDETRINVDDRINLARRTLYSLLKTGVHGSNGLNPKTSYRIYQAYVLPRLLYGLETLHVNSKEMSLLSSFHLDTLRKLQSLPKRTACASVYLLLGALPLIAEIHKRQLSLLFGVLNSDNETIRSLAMRQYMSGRSTSFFTKTAEILEMYNLPFFLE